MAIAINKKMKERAKADGKPLIQISMDCRHLTKEQIAALPEPPFTPRYAAMSGPAPVDLANAIMRLWIERWINKGDIKE